MQYQTAIATSEMYTSVSGLECVYFFPMQEERTRIVPEESVGTTKVLPGQSGIFFIVLTEVSVQSLGPRHSIQHINCCKEGTEIYDSDIFTVQT